MADIFPKFIIETDDEEGDCLIIGKVTYHGELVTDKEKVKGGGWFRFHDSTMTFFGDSHDFGAAKLEDIKGCVENNKVFTNSSLIRSLPNAYKFFYDTKTELISLN